MAKQTFTTGQVLTAAQQNSLQANDYNQTVSVKTASYILTAADKGTRIEFNTSGSVTCTVNTGLFDAGDTLIIQNRGAGTATVTAGTATVNTSGSLVVNQYESGTLYFISASAALWFGSNPGDITAVTAGTGISGGGTSGAVTITNSMATEITAKGDLIVGTGNATFDNLPVGTNGYTLVADSSVSPTGLKWAAPAAAAFVGCKAYLSGNQSITNNTATALTYGSESFDTDAFHSTSTNTSRFTIPSGKGGKYRFDAQVQFNQVAGAEAGLRSAAFFKNGTQVTAGVLMNTSTDESTAFCLSYVADLVATDYVELFVFHTQGASVNCSGGEANNYVALEYLGA